MHLFYRATIALSLVVCFFSVCPLMAGEASLRDACSKEEKENYETILTDDGDYFTLPNGPGLTIGDLASNLPDRRTLSFAAALVSTGLGLGTMAFHQTYVTRECPVTSDPARCVMLMIGLVGIECSLLIWPWVPESLSIKRALIYFNLLPESALIKIIAKRIANDLLTEADFKACGTAIVTVMPGVLNKLSNTQARQLLTYAQNYRDWLDACDEGMESATQEPNNSHPL